MMLNSRREIEPYTPHSCAMLLLDRVVEHSLEHIVTELVISPRLPFYDDGRVPAYLGIEIMAQSISVWSGMRRAEPSSRPPIGYLLGTRRFASTLGYFKEGCRLTIHAQRVIENEGLAAFDCSIEQLDSDGAQSKVATANISVFSAPENSNQDQP